MLREHIPDAAVRVGIESAVGAGRLIQPEEVAETVYFCATQPVLNGAVLHANLGQIER
jgi:3-oxoacyl-[acyl-carrier protein] reductase